MSFKDREGPKNKVYVLDNRKCVRCKKWIRKLSGNERSIKNADEVQIVKKAVCGNVNIGDVLCYNCKKFFSFNIKVSNIKNPVPTEIQNQSSFVDCLQNSDVSIETQKPSCSKYSLRSSNVPIDIQSPSSSKTVLENSDLPVVPQKLSTFESSSKCSDVSIEPQTSSSSQDFVQSQSSTDEPPYTVEQRPETQKPVCAVLPIERTVITHKYCCICGSSANLKLIPFEARMQSFVKRRIFIPKGNRCCNYHLISTKKRFFDEELKNISVYSNSSSIEVDELSKYLEILSLRTDSTILGKGDFSMSEKDLKTFTGLTWENIRYLADMMVSMRNTESRTITQSLITFLLKLRTGNSNSLIASILGLEREQTVSDYCHSVLKSFEKDVLPTRFGFGCFSRDYLIENHTSPTASQLLNIDKQLALIFDGTYIRHEKSSNNEYQRKSFSGQKKLPLCKPFTICTTDGFIVDVPGPFYATENDATIMKKLLSNPNGLRSILTKDDYCIVDRGFRDVKQDLESLNYKVLMPALKGHRSQLTTEESNASRVVTKMRWVVEAIHGIIGKKFRLLHQQLDNKILPTVGLYIRIACFLQNTFGQRLNSDAGRSEEIINRMLMLKPVENTLAKEVENEKWARRTVIFRKMTLTELSDFPELTEDDLIMFFSGTYQLGQAISYLAEMMDDENGINVQYLKVKPNILKFLVRSRHINRKTYKCFLEYKPDTTGISGISRYCCDCANGLRTIGCCSHLAAVIYYLSHGRYKARIIRPAQILSGIFDFNDMSPVINEDSDYDD